MCVYVWKAGAGGDILDSGWSNCAFCISGNCSFRSLFCTLKLLRGKVVLTHENVMVLPPSAWGKRGKCAPLIRHSLGMFSEDKRQKTHTLTEDTGCWSGCKAHRSVWQQHPEQEPQAPVVDCYWADELAGFCIQIPPSIPPSKATYKFHLNNTL